VRLFPGSYFLPHFSSSTLKFVPAWSKHRQSFISLIFHRHFHPSRQNFLFPSSSVCCVLDCQREKTAPDQHATGSIHSFQAPWFENWFNKRASGPSLLFPSQRGLSVLRNNHSQPTVSIRIDGQF